MGCSVAVTNPGMVRECTDTSWTCVQVYYKCSHQMLSPETPRLLCSKLKKRAEAHMLFHWSKWGEQIKVPILAQRDSCALLKAVPEKSPIHAQWRGKHLA